MLNGSYHQHSANMHSTWKKNWTNTGIDSARFSETIFFSKVFVQTPIKYYSNTYTKRTLIERLRIRAP